VRVDHATNSKDGQPQWRSYFRSTLGHNTLQLDGQDQSGTGGPFLWIRHARSRVIVAHPHEDGISRWSAEHDGYTRRGRPVRHRRSVELDSGTQELRVFDEVLSPQPHPCQLAFHLGPQIEAQLTGKVARLSWTVEGQDRSAVLELPPALAWTAHRGETSPPLGWYSGSFGRRQPAYTLIGSGTAGGEAAPLATLLQFRSR